MRLRFPEPQALASAQPAVPLPAGRIGGRAQDLSLYDRHAAAWWDRDGRFAGTLHAINVLRLAQIRRAYADELRGLRVVDLGCGGGLLAEPLARAGARVTGIDASPGSLAAARAHGAGIAGVDYVHGDARRPPLRDGSADLVCCADVLEHVDGWPAVVAAAARLLRPGGRFYVTTLNRTWRAALLAVRVAEGLGLVPRGTHDPRRFIRPRELVAAAAAHGLVEPVLLGQRLRWSATLRTWHVHVADGRSLAIGYATWFTRGGTR